MLIWRPFALLARRDLPGLKFPSLMHLGIFSCCIGIGFISAHPAAATDGRELAVGV
jgi:hypothetical protein